MGEYMIIGEGGYFPHSRGFVSGGVYQGHESEFNQVTLFSELGETITLPLSQVEFIERERVMKPIAQQSVEGRYVLDKMNAFYQSEIQLDIATYIDVMEPKAIYDYDELSGMFSKIWDERKGYAQ